MAEAAQGGAHGSGGVGGNAAGLAQAHADLAQVREENERLLDLLGKVGFSDLGFFEQAHQTLFCACTHTRRSCCSTFCL